MAKEIKSNYNVIGVMAGSSMDGLDLADISFSHNGTWTFQLNRKATISYDEKIFKRLAQSPNLSRDEQSEIDKEFGNWIAGKIKDFCGDHHDLIAVHGHTVVHKPEEGVTWQLGDGEIIAQETGITTMTDFRSLDVKLGGQGAPLVPIGDFELFSAFDACLNLGGIANVSMRDRKIAWDICPCNQVLDYYSIQLGQPFDSEGRLARNGAVEKSWLKQLEEIPFFRKKYPKSLPNQFLKKHLLDQVLPEIGLSSYTTFIARQIMKDLEKELKPKARVLVTGGGAFNTYLIELLNTPSSDLQFVVPVREIVMFKEAIVFGFLGVLRIREEINVLASVTGSSKDSSSGQIHFAK